MHEDNPPQQDTSRQAGDARLEYAAEREYASNFREQKYHSQARSIWRPDPSPKSRRA
jgi:hypothetical protein